MASVSETCTVSELLSQDCDKMTFEEKLKVKQRGRPVPLITFDGKRQCRLSDHYARFKWMCGCPEQKALFCFPCLIFKQNKLISWTLSRDIAFCDKIIDMFASMKQRRINLVYKQ